MKSTRGIKAIVIIMSLLILAGLVGVGIGMQRAATQLISAQSQP